MANSLNTTGLTLGNITYTSDMFTGTNIEVNPNVTNSATISGNRGKIITVSVYSSVKVTSSSGSWLGYYFPSYSSGTRPAVSPVGGVGASFQIMGVAIGNPGGGGIFIRVS